MYVCAPGPLRLLTAHCTLCPSGWKHYSINIHVSATVTVHHSGSILGFATILWFNAHWPDLWLYAPGTGWYFQGYALMSHDLLQSSILINYLFSNNTPHKCEISKVNRPPTGCTWSWGSGDKNTTHMTWEMRKCGNKTNSWRTTVLNQGRN